MTNKQQPILLLPTNEDTTGPYFPAYFSDESYEDLTQIHSGIIAGPTGQHIILRGSVLDRNGKLANGVLLEFWQANAKGIYRNPSSENHPDLDPWFDGYGRLRSTTGEYTYRTILPGASKDRAPNITVTIFSDGINRIVTQIFFANQKANETDPLLKTLSEQDKTRLTAKYEGPSPDGAEVYTLDIIMAGNNETPFFDDFLS